MSLDHVKRYICCQQQELFEYAQKQNADIIQFAFDFLNSDFCNRSLDKPYSADQYMDIMNWLEFLEQEDICLSNYNTSDPISNQIAGWLGFTYRQIQIESGLSSSEIIRRVPVDRMILSYPGLHTVDEDMAADIIIHDFNLK